MSRSSTHPGSRGVSKERLGKSAGTTAGSLVFHGEVKLRVVQLYGLES